VWSISKRRAKGRKDGWGPDYNKGIVTMSIGDRDGDSTCTQREGYKGEKQTGTFTQSKENRVPQGTGMRYRGQDEKGRGNRMGWRGKGDEKWREQREIGWNSNNVHKTGEIDEPKGIEKTRQEKGKEKGEKCNKAKCDDMKETQTWSVKDISFRPMTQSKC
jgi:hypothetical protein